jgi:predicted Rossmann-fold nucleotide-binding protein
MVDAIITPRGPLDLLSRSEIASLQSSSGEGSFHNLFRNCALAVLSTGADSDDGHQLLARHSEFEIELLSSRRGVKLSLKNAPENAFVDGKIITGISQHLFAVLRDIVYLQNQYPHWQQQEKSITDLIFKTLRNAHALTPRKRPNLVVCWGGHSINDIEYDYSKEVGYRLGLRMLDICTGCGIGAMKGPMKGAHIAHGKQRINGARYIGITEPGIIASEAPNATVNKLIIMPDIEKRLEAFVRLGHAIVVFPGGVGTTEEILYILGILLNENNKDVTLPLILTGPKSSVDYFKQLHEFIGLTLGAQAQTHYEIIIDDPIKVAQVVDHSMRDVYRNRRSLDDAFYYNWALDIDCSFQQSFVATHENMASLNLSRSQSTANLAADLRRAFSGIVAGNVKPQGIQAIHQHGPYQLTGDADIMSAMDSLLDAFVQQKRMKVSGQYDPCYELQNVLKPSE